MRYIDEFLRTTEGDLSNKPAMVVERAASALLAISFLREDKPVLVKKGGLPVFQHRIPIVGYGYSVDMNVKPHESHFLKLQNPQERVFAAGLPASLRYFYKSFRTTTFSFDSSSDSIVAVEFVDCGGGDSSATEAGTNAIRNVWQQLHEPTTAYVQQVADQLA